MSLVDVVKEDFGYAKYIVKPVISGAIQGIYTPFRVTSLFKSIVDYVDQDSLRIRNGEKVKNPIPFIVESAMKGSIGITLGVQIGIYAHDNKMLGAYLGTLAVTNTADYIYNAHKRSKDNI